ncbi:MAG: hypothetical protein J7494_11760 [Sphingobium sp.]|nr:hypothetical protein [Sphingobium sp.]
MRADDLTRRDLLIAAGAASCAALAPSAGSATGWSAEKGGITDMTMNAPSYSTPIGYGRADHTYAVIDPLALAFG